MKLILLGNFGSTLFMVGLIWFVQIVHYPLYANVGREQFPEYERLHNQLTTWVVGPAMLLEVITAAILLKFPLRDSASLAWFGAGLLAVIWITTATLSIPAHNALISEFSMTQYHKLVSTNWIRTVGWSMRGVIVAVMTYRQLSP